MINNEVFYTMALTRLMHFNFQQALELYKTVGSAALLYEHRHDIGDLLKDCSPRLVQGLNDWSEALRRTESEVAFIEKHAIQVLTFHNDNYPQRLKECPDAPIVLYYRGNADLNQQKIISIVGTRQMTTYGDDMIRRLISDLRQQCPQVLIVSGLAYGVDICAHGYALENGYETVGVLAHGLDQIYPYRHRGVAARMVLKGGLLTEFMSQTNADKPNFVRRNRIVAGMADATILVESAAKGGGMITAELAQSYDRNVFAFPGAVGMAYSEGCNKMIRDNVASLITGAEDFLKAMDWQDEARLRQARAEGIERSLFPDLSTDEQRIVDELMKTNDLQLNILSVRTGLPIGQLTSLLFQLELKGVVKPLAGGMYHVLRS